MKLLLQFNKIVTMVTIYDLKFSLKEAKNETSKGIAFNAGLQLTLLYVEFDRNSKTFELLEFNKVKFDVDC